MHVAKLRIKQLRRSNPQDYNCKPHDYIGVCWTAARRVLNGDLRHVLRKVGLWDDIRQEIALVAFECERDGLTVKETLRAADRAIYHALVAMGFKKPRGGRWEREAVTFSEVTAPGRPGWFNKTFEEQMFVDVEFDEHLSFKGDEE